MAHDHDASYKLLFSSPELVRDLVMGFIPDDWLHSLDYSTLEKVPGSYVTDDLRHRAAAQFFRMGLDIPRVALLTGHRTWTMLRRYTSIKPEDVHNAIKKPASPAPDHAGQQGGDREALNDPTA